MQQLREDYYSSSKTRYASVRSNVLNSTRSFSFLFSCSAFLQSSVIRPRPLPLISSQCLRKKKRFHLPESFLCFRLIYYHVSKLRINPFSSGITISRLAGILATSIVSRTRRFLLLLFANELSRLAS